MSRHTACPRASSCRCATRPVLLRVLRLSCACAAPLLRLSPPCAPCACRVPSCHPGPSLRRPCAQPAPTLLLAYHPPGAKAGPLPVLWPLKVVALRVKRPGRCDPVPRPPPGVSRAPPPVARQVCSNRLVFEPTSGHLRAIEPSPPITGLNKHHTYARNRRWLGLRFGLGVVSRSLRLTLALTLALTRSATPTRGAGAGSTSRRRRVGGSC